MKQKKILERINILVGSDTPIIYIQSWDEEYIKTNLAEIAKENKKLYYIWSAASGLYPYPEMRKADKGTLDPFVALENIDNFVSQAVFVLLDFHLFLDNPKVARKLRDFSQKFKESKKTVIILSPTFYITPELNREAVLVVDTPFGHDFIKNVINIYAQQFSYNMDEMEEVVENAIDLLKGLTLTELSNVLIECLKKYNKLDINFLLKEKGKIVNKILNLEIIKNDIEKINFIGFDLYKNWIENFQFIPGGITSLAFLGFNGCGKTIAIKLLAEKIKAPIVKFNTDLLNNLEGKEGVLEIRKIINHLNSYAPLVIWIDEFNSFFLQQSQTPSMHSDVFKPYISELLEWIKNQKKNLVVFSSTELVFLPKKFINHNIFDIVWFIDFPTKAEREIFLKKYFADNPNNINISDLIKNTMEFSYADLNALIKIATNFAGSINNITDNNLTYALNFVKPKKTYDEQQINEIRVYAENNFTFVSSFKNKIKKYY